MPNKKEPLSIIAVKTILAVAIFAGVGTIIIGGGWLIGNNKKVSEPVKEDIIIDNNKAENEIMVEDETKDETADWKTYRNEEYEFELIFPDRWKNCRIKEGNNYVSFSLEFKNPVIFDDGRKKYYDSLFFVAVHTKEEWKSIQSAVGPKPTYLNENNDYVFAFSMGHDDAGFAGFPEDKLNEEYQGPFYDVKNKILPTFKFIEK